MKKLAIVIAVIVAILAVALGLGPWYTSRNASAQIASAVAAINSQGLFRATYTPATRGWFGQEGTLTLTPADPRLLRLAGPNARQRPVAVHLHIAYGPVPFTAWSRDGMSFAPVAAVVDARIDGLDNALKKAGSGYLMRDVIDLDGGSSLLLRLDAGTFSQPNGDHAQWSSSRLDLRQRAGRWNGSGHTGHFALTSKDASGTSLDIGSSTLKVGNFTIIDGQSAGKFALSWKGMQVQGLDRHSGQIFRMDLGQIDASLDTRLAEGLAVGKGRFALARLSVWPNNAAPPLLVMQGMRLSSDTTLPQGTYADSTQQWDIQRIEAGPQTFGPGHMVLHLDHQYLPALRAMLEAMRSLQRQWRSAPPVPPQRAFESLLSAIMPSLYDFIAHRPVLRLTEFSLGTPQGTLQASGEASLDQASAAPSLSNLRQELVARLRLIVPAPLAREFVSMGLSQRGVSAQEIPSQTQATLDHMQKAGILQMRGSGFRMDMSYRAGTLLFNGRLLQTP